ncbi:uncharacterized protein MELLADRAFT_49258 [Melampsora larici-populina 98AG31]|uniref:Uncharacterized protein n=1 Tax=Melampsora larici-populina (strain 98AG31 / pathotype 3-4-7) TaxID=747676 RepID=F4RTY1_MELLP|nr:uncharacterized protein MELLADRAFT_49258 [Melampsora larici-populina 98AG31]EGG04182.1 hypothetical protein MELLADRAFT_49258 [Melampsora larici-populina 98AG31]
MSIDLISSCLPFLNKMMNQLTISSNEPSNQEEVDILILGAGWTCTFLIPYIKTHTKLTYASTTRNGGGEFNSIPFTFDSTGNNSKSYEKLPFTKCILITFPIKEIGAYQTLLENYSQTHQNLEGFESVNVIQLGSTGIFDGGPTLNPTSNSEKPKRSETYIDRHSPYDQTNIRAKSEDELLRINQTIIGSMKFYTTVLNLSGLYGNERSIRNYVSKVAPTKEILSTKTSIHMIHGIDVSRSILEVFNQFEKSRGQRWILTDQRVYDWWDLASAWGESGLHGRKTEVTIGPQAKWVQELMVTDSIKVLPRSPDQLGRVLDSTEFWRTFGISPVRARLESL